MDSHSKEDQQSPPSPPKLELPATSADHPNVGTKGPMNPAVSQFLVDETTEEEDSIPHGAQERVYYSRSNQGTQSSEKNNATQIATSQQESNISAVARSFQVQDAPNIADQESNPSDAAPFTQVPHVSNVADAQVSNADLVTALESTATAIPSTTQALNIFCWW